jgi:hypothetical protein
VHSSLQTQELFSGTFTSSLLCMSWVPNHWSFTFLYEFLEGGEIFWKTEKEKVQGLGWPATWAWYRQQRKGEALVGLTVGWASLGRFLQLGLGLLGWPLTGQKAGGGGAGLHGWCSSWAGWFHQAGSGVVGSWAWVNKLGCWARGDGWAKACAGLRVRGRLGWIEKKGGRLRGPREVRGFSYFL